MASRVFTSSSRTTAASASRFVTAPIQSTSFRSFQTSRTLKEAVVAPVTVKKPVGAFRGGIFGFLLGSTLAGASVYYYILEEYKVSNQLLSEDIYALQSAVQATHSHVTELENRLAQQGKK